MIFMFTKNKLPFSKILQWCLKEPSSHFACVFMLTPKHGVVVHQRFNGFTVNFLHNFLEKNDVVAAIKPKTTNLKMEKRIFLALMNRYDGTEYDFKGLLYFCWRVVLLKLVNAPIPKVNRWGSNKEPICTGVSNEIRTIKPDWFSEDFIDGDIITPWRLYLMMMGTGKFEDIKTDGSSSRII